MNSIHVVAILAVLQYFLFGILVGRARVRHGVKAPAVTGNVHFERAFRVQMNTLEQLVGFLPALWIAGQYWPSALVAGLGAVYLVGRVLYARAYVADPQRRGLGFALTMVPTLILLALGLVGALAGR